MTLSHRTNLHSGRSNRLTACVFLFFICVVFYMTLSHCTNLRTGRQDPRAVDVTRSHRLPQVHLRLRRVELRRGDVGGDVVRREALLELVQPGRHQGRGEGIPPATSYGKEPGVLRPVNQYNWLYLGDLQG